MGMGSRLGARRVFAACALVALATAGGVIGSTRSVAERPAAHTGYASAAEKYAGGEIARPSPGGRETGADGGESAERASLEQWFADARGVVEPGAYSRAFATLTGLSTTS